MRKFTVLLLITFMSSCGQSPVDKGKEVITVSIAPFKYFVDEISGNDFTVNVMVAPGADPHIYEPFPEQIRKLSRSIGYISNGYLGFEEIWLSRFYETNKSMKRLSLGDNIDLLFPEEKQHVGHVEAADPHYWTSPKCGMIIASSVKEFLCELSPENSERYETNYKALISRIQDLDSNARQLFSGLDGKSFMIFHPNLGYMARDYNLNEITLEIEGKEPSPARLRELIDIARANNINTIFVQREYDKKNAEAIAGEIGAGVKVIDPLSEEWLISTTEIINSVYSSLSVNIK